MVTNVSQPLPEEKHCNFVGAETSSSDSELCIVLYSIIPAPFSL
jgi:hypothetical protein